jgi:regulator of cell morphogenesis and NO signaling
MFTTTSRAATDYTTLTINEIMARWPDTMMLLNALGIDTCCGGGDTLPDAARRARIPLTVLMAAVEHGAQEFPK